MRQERLIVMALAAAAGLLIATGTVAAKGTGLVFVSNEKSSTITVLGPDHAVVESFATCARPRGLHFDAGHTGFYVACGDDDTIALYDIASRKLVKRFRDIPDPETFDLHPNGKHLYASNEDDAAVSVIDVETGAITATYEAGEEPEGVQITADGKYVFVTSEAASLVHVIDTAKNAVVKDIPVGTRPRRFALTPGDKELWVSAELSGIIDIIDVASLANVGQVAFLPPGLKKEQVTPVDVVITRDGARAYVALGRANHVAVVDVKSRAVIDYLLVGKRPWGLKLNRDETLLYVANGLSDDVTIIDTAANRAVISVPVGEVPYGILIDDE